MCAEKLAREGNNTGSLAMHLELASVETNFCHSPHVALISEGMHAGDDYRVHKWPVCGDIKVRSLVNKQL